MNEVVGFLNENPIQYLGTTDKEGNPKVRPFKFMLEKDGKLFLYLKSKRSLSGIKEQSQHRALC